MKVSTRNGRPPACPEARNVGPKGRQNQDAVVAGTQKAWFCYMVRCRDGSFYVGMTNDLEERIKEHNWGVKSEYTTKRRPVQLVWREPQADRAAASKREREIKGWSRKKKLELVEAYRRRENPSPADAGSG